MKIFGTTGCKKGETVALDKSIPSVDLEQDSEPEKTFRRSICVGKRKHSDIGLKKNEEAGSELCCVFFFFFFKQVVNCS